tara:strand:+ start:390 stop:1061 length:672 start_codon:yes stop_codon:yes gene_type:complete
MLSDSSAAFETSIKREADAPPETELSSKVARKTPADAGEPGPGKKPATKLDEDEQRKKPLPSFGAPPLLDAHLAAAPRRPSPPAPRDASLAAACLAEVRFIERDPGFAPEGLRDASYKDLGKLVALFSDDKYMMADLGARGEWFLNGREGVLFWVRRVRSHLAERLGYLPDEVLDPNSTLYKYDLSQARVQQCPGPAPLAVPRSAPLAQRACSEHADPIPPRG